MSHPLQRRCSITTVQQLSGTHLTTFFLLIILLHVILTISGIRITYNLCNGKRIIDIELRGRRSRIICCLRLIRAT